TLPDRWQMRHQGSASYFGFIGIHRPNLPRQRYRTSAPNRVPLVTKSKTSNRVAPTCIRVFAVRADRQRSSIDSRHSLILKSLLSEPLLHDLKQRLDRCRPAATADSRLTWQALRPPQSDPVLFATSPIDRLPVVGSTQNDQSNRAIRMDHSVF